MSGIILTLGSVGILCASGFGLSTALKWFHSYEVEVPSKKGKKRSGVAEERKDHLQRRLKGVE